MSSHKFDPMTRAKTRLVVDHPFFATLAMRTQIKVNNNMPTAYCDGKNIGYNEEFVSKLTDPQVVGLLVHELYHKVFMHHLRIGDRHPAKWNVACDYAINPLIAEIAKQGGSGVELPPGGLLDQKYANMTAEEIYAKLPDPPGGWSGKGEDPGKCGGIRIPGDGQSRAEAEAQVKQDIAAAVHTAKQRGKLPAGMDIYLDDLLEPQVPWKDVLKRFMTEKAPDDYSWQKPNRRYIGSGLYLPARYSEDTAGEFAFGVDTSGSMLGVLPTVMSEVNGIMEEIQPLRSHVIYCDSAVGRYDTFERGQPLEVHPNGGGGTDFCPVFDKIAEEGIQPKCLVFITDGYGTFPTEAPGYPVLWVMTEDVKPPFGEVIRVEA